MMIEQRCHEWRVKMWVAIDLPSPTTRFGTPSKLVISSMKAAGMTDEESDMFEITIGTKQDDLLSSLLFNTVLQVALKDDLPRCQKKKGM